MKNVNVSKLQDDNLGSWNRDGMRTEPDSRDGRCRAPIGNNDQGETKGDSAGEDDGSVVGCNANTWNPQASLRTANCNNHAANADNQTSACKTQTDLAKELNDNPLKQGDNGMWWKYNPTTKQYEDTGIGAIGGILYPSFYHRRNHLMLVDYNQYVSNRVSYNRNRLKFKI